MTTSSTPKVVFIGGGGHAAVCLDAFGSRSREVIGNCSPHRGELDAPYLGVDDELGALSTADVMVFVAIGDNRLRMRPMASVLELGFSLAKEASPHAVVSPSATFGAGAVVSRGAVLNARSRSVPGSS